MATEVLFGGPFSGEERESYSAVPARRVPIYELKQGLVCDDEQVSKLLGHYVRDSIERGYTGSGRWNYRWEPSDVQ